jgi:signal transduction histidine kinase
VAFAVMAGVVCLVIGLIVYRDTANGLYGRARDQAAQEARAARDGSIAGRLPLGAQTDTSFVPRLLVARVHAGHVATIVQGDRVWGGAPTGGHGVYVSDALADEEHELSSLRRTLVLTGLIATIVGALIGVALAIWLSARLRRAARIARQIASGALGERVRLGGRDETASLGHAIDEMADALEQQIVRERQFAADAAHELRTPVAGIVASSALLPAGDAATMVRSGAAQLHRLVDQLLELGRLEGGLDALVLDEVDLARVANGARSVYPSLDVDAPDEAVVRTDLRRIERILANLIENALRYGAPPVVLHVHGSRIAVSDRGPGFPPDLLDHATERFAVADTARSEGVGLGLAIAAEHARALGSRLEIENRADGGCIVGLELTSSPVSRPRVAG